MKGTGTVCGIDMTLDMAKAAQQNLAQAGVTGFEIKTIDSEKIPYPDSTFDLIVSNGVINLCLDKKTCFGEIHRVLKPGAG